MPQLMTMQGVDLSLPHPMQSDNQRRNATEPFYPSYLQGHGTRSDVGLPQPGTRQTSVASQEAIVQNSKAWSRSREQVELCSQIETENPYRLDMHNTQVKYLQGSTTSSQNNTPNNHAQHSTSVQGHFKLGGPGRSLQQGVLLLNYPASQFHPAMQSECLVRIHSSN